jgi:hypothetical protein
MMDESIPRFGTPDSRNLLFDRVFQIFTLCDLFDNNDLNQEQDN